LLINLLLKIWTPLQRLTLFVVVFVDETGKILGKNGKKLKDLQCTVVFNSNFFIFEFL